MATNSISRFEAIADTICARINRGVYPPGSWLPGTTELAQEFGVAPNTIQTAMRLVTNRGLVIRRHRVGTFVTRASMARSVGLLLASDLLNRTDAAYLRNILRRLYTEARKHGLTMRTILFEHDQVPDGLVDELASATRSGELRGLLTLGGLPVRLRTDLLNHVDLPWVETCASVDYRILTRVAVTHLIEQHWQRIVVIGHHGANPHQNDDTLLGAADAARIAGLPPKAIALAPILANEAEEGLQAMASLLDGYRPDAVVVANDGATAGVMMALLQRGLRPGRDIGLVSHSNRGLPILSPVALTRVEVASEQVAPAMLDRLERILSGKPAPDLTILPMTLIIGESCGHRRRRLALDHRATSDSRLANNHCGQPPV